MAIASPLLLAYLIQSSSGKSFTTRTHLTLHHRKHTREERY